MCFSDFFSSLVSSFFVPKLEIGSVGSEIHRLINWVVGLELIFSLNLLLKSDICVEIELKNLL